MSDPWADAIDNRLAELRRWREIMRLYLQMKVDQQDFHGAQDAASDLRDIDERIAGIEEARR